MALRKGSVPHEAAMVQACQELKISVDDGEVALKIALTKNPLLEPGKPWEPPQCFTCEDSKEVWNKGPGKRKLPCPDCCKGNAPPEDGA
jgi:hypothetical protein